MSRPSDRRASVLSRSEEDNRIARKNRKEWSVSKSQVLLERQSDTDVVRLYMQELFLYAYMLSCFHFCVENTVLTLKVIISPVCKTVSVIHL